MTDSQRLLAEYARNGSESAFRELVARYINFVYSTALRLVAGDTHLAEDVAQTVFIGLARKGRTLSTGVMLGGWLHQHTYHVATKAMRTDRRRQSREREAMEMNTLSDDSGADLRQFAPMLDEAITRLGSEDRAAILLRFFEQRDFRSVGEALGSNEDAARMRVNRALEKLHSLLKQRGVTLSATALGAALTADIVTAAPAGLAVTISGAAMTGAAAGTGSTLTLLKFMAATNLKLGISALVVASATTALVFQHQAQTKLREENQSLRQQVGQLTAQNERFSKHPPAPRLPAPPMRVTAQPKALPTENLPPKNLYARFKDTAPRLTAGQVEAYLRANGREASSLLAAYRTSENRALLKEAMEKYPNDPQVAFEGAFANDLTPEAQRQWLNTFEKSAPDNALANYLSALNYFNTGRTDEGIQELAAASGKSFEDYTVNRVQDDVEVYLAAGYSMAEAKAMASMQLMLPHLAQVKQLGVDLVDLAKAYSQAGDQASAQAALQMAMNLGQSFASESTSAALVSQLVGTAIEKIALSAMDPNSPYGESGQTIQDQLNQITQQRTAAGEIVQQAEPFMQMLSDQDWINYTDRRMLFGEVAARQWVVSKYGQK